MRAKYQKRKYIMNGEDLNEPCSIQEIDERRAAQRGRGEQQRGRVHVLQGAWRVLSPPFVIPEYTTAANCGRRRRAHDAAAISETIRIS